jgi:hypothetical protein
MSDGLCEQRLTDRVTAQDTYGITEIYGPNDFYLYLRNQWYAIINLADNGAA